MGFELVCRKKDKRLLVLLALGSLIVLSDSKIPELYTPVVSGRHHWLEIREEGNRLYRFGPSGFPVDFQVADIQQAGSEIILPALLSETIHKEMKQGRTVSLLRKQDGSAAPARVSPRLALFLGQPLSINTADPDTLTLIPGIGSTLAGNIITYREKYGPITGQNQLEEIPGIGPRMRKKLQNYFTCSVDGE